MHPGHNDLAFALATVGLRADTITPGTPLAGARPRVSPSDVDELSLVTLTSSRACGGAAFTSGAFGRGRFCTLTWSITDDERRDSVGGAGCTVTLEVAVSVRPEALAKSEPKISLVEANTARPEDSLLWVRVEVVRVEGFTALVDGAICVASLT